MKMYFHIAGIFGARSGTYFNLFRFMLRNIRTPVAISFRDTRHKFGVLYLVGSCFHHVAVSLTQRHDPQLSLFSVFVVSFLFFLVFLARAFSVRHPARIQRDTWLHKFTLRSRTVYEHDTTRERRR